MTQSKGFWSELQARLWTQLDGAWLAAFRATYGLSLFASITWILVHSVWPAPGQGSWLDYHLVQPRFHFKYWGFSWVEPLPGHGVYYLLCGLAVLSLLIAAGLAFRVSALLCALGFSYFQLLEAALYANHYYLTALFGWLLALSPAGRVGSVDNWLARRAPARVSALWLYLFRFQMAVVYSFAGLAKANADWLLHAQPLRIWLSAQADMPVFGPLLAAAWVAPLASWIGFLFDATIAVWLSIARTRRYAYGALIAFHAATYVLFPRIVMFPVIMVLSALVFFSPSWPRQLAAWLRGVAPVALPPTAAARPRFGLLGLSVAALYALVQLALPLRFVAYGGDLRWHEQGLRFGWRVLHREKLGTVTFHVRSVSTGRGFEVAPEQYLTAVQAVEMAEQPDLILQLAHHIRDDFAARGVGPVEVRADTLVTLNGRTAARLIDPQADLAALDTSLRPAAWILPVPSEPPPHIRAAR